MPEYDVDEPSADHPYCRDIRYHTAQENMRPVARDHRRAYYGRVTWVDRQLGRLLDAVGSAGLLESTVVGYTSDHGDLQATVFGAAGGDRPADWWGEPLQEIAPADANRAVFAEYSGHATRGSAFMVRQDRWKLIWNARAPHQLFDLQDDPHELRNLAEEQPDRVAGLTKILTDRFCDPEREQERAEEFIEAQIRALEATGAHVP